MALSWWISPSLRPATIASRTAKIRSGVGVRRARARAGGSQLASGRSQPQPAWPVSRERRAFWNDSSKQRPIAIASPTDFIEVVSTGVLPRNFSKAKRGIFVTT